MPPPLLRAFAECKPENGLDLELGSHWLQVELPSPPQLKRPVTPSEVEAQKVGRRAPDPHSPNGCLCKIEDQ